MELAYIKPKNQRYIAVAIEGQQSAPSLSQAQRMRELDQKGVLNGDVIDGIMMEDKKEVDKVILTGAELGKYFGKETTPREMKDQIIKLLDDWKGQQKEAQRILNIPRRRFSGSISGKISQGPKPPWAVPKAPLTDFSRLCFQAASDGDIYSFEPFPFPREGAEGLGSSVWLFLICRNGGTKP